MIKLLKHSRIQIPNSLAIVAAFVLVVSSIVGFEGNRQFYSSAQDNGRTVQTDNAGTDSISNATGKKSRRLNIGSLLFRNR